MPPLCERWSQSGRPYENYLAPPLSIMRRDWHCSWRAAKHLLPATHGEIRDGIKVRAQHFGVLEELVSESVEPVQRDEQVGGGHPFLGEKKEEKKRPLR